MMSSRACPGPTPRSSSSPDLGFSPFFRGMRGKVAIYNENLRSVAARHGCLVVDLSSLTAIQDAGMWAPDRLHFSPLGHHAIARSVLSALRVENSLQPSQIEPLPLRCRPGGAHERVMSRGRAPIWCRGFCDVLGTNSRTIIFCPNAPRPAHWAGLGSDAVCVRWLLCGLDRVATELVAQCGDGFHRRGIFLARFEPRED